LFGTFDGSVYRWDTRSEMPTRIGRHEAAVYTLAFSPDGRILASSGEDGVIRLWNAADWQAGRTLRGDDGPIETIAFIPRQNTILAAGCRDGAIRFWNIETEQVTLTLDEHSASVHSLAFASDGRTLVSGSYDRTLRIWQRE